MIADEIAATAKRCWSVHPKAIRDAGLTREEYYAEEMRKLCGGLLKDILADIQARSVRLNARALDVPNTIRDLEIIYEELLSD